MSNDTWEFRIRDVRRVVDGDTYDFEVDLGFRQYGVYRFRLRDVNTPEIYGMDKDSVEYQAGKAAQAYVEDWLAIHFDDPNTQLWVRTYEEQTFNRWVADVYATGTDEEEADLGQALIHNGHGMAV